MTTSARLGVVGLLVIAAVGMAGAAGDLAAGPQSHVFLGACYCRAAGRLECTGNLSERECGRQCNEALCDEWFWKERLPCWNWGYGG